MRIRPREQELSIPRTLLLFVFTSMQEDETDIISIWHTGGRFYRNGYSTNSKIENVLSMNWICLIWWWDLTGEYFGFVLYSIELYPFSHHNINFRIKTYNILVYGIVTNETLISIFPGCYHFILEYIDICATTTTSTKEHFYPKNIEINLLITFRWGDI